MKTKMPRNSQDTPEEKKKNEGIHVPVIKTCVRAIAIDTVWQ